MIMENQEVNATPQVPVKRSNGVGLAGFIISIIGVIFCWIPIINLIGLVLVIIAFILCLIGLIFGLKKKRTIVLSIIGLVLSVAGIIIAVAILAAAASAVSSTNFNFN
jgi:hypothetical protein